MSVKATRRRLTPEARLAEIVATSTRLISERGFWGLTLQDVAEACAMTVAGLLHHVGNKDGLLVAVLRHRDAADLAELAHLRAEHDGHPRAFLDALVARNVQQPEIVRLYAVLGAESLAPDHPAHEFFQERVTRTRGNVAARLAGHAPDPEGLSVQLLALMDGLQLHWLGQLDSFDLLASWRSAADRLLPLDPPPARSAD